MNSEAIPHLVSPVKKSPLHLVKPRKSKDRIVSGFLVNADETESFRVTAGIPLLLPFDYPSEWIHPVHEVLLGDEASKITSRFAEGGPEKFTVNLSSYIQKKLGRRGIIKAFEEYGNISVQQRYESFICILEEEKSVATLAISKRDFAKGLNHVRSRTAKARLERMRPNIGASHLSEYAGSIADTNPKILIELGCGSCFGTQAVVERFQSFERLFPIDIDFVCTKVAEGLYMYQGESHRIDPLVGSFWFLPFRNSSIDCVFTRNALRESREIVRVIQEVSRVLKLGGRFVCLEGSEPSLVLPLFDDLEFSISERRHLASTARLYAGVDNLCEMALSNGLKVISKKEIFPSKGVEKVLCVFEKCNKSLS